jgi:hypothetical protein
LAHADHLPLCPSPAQLVCARSRQATARYWQWLLLAALIVPGAPVLPRLDAAARDWLIMTLTRIGRDACVFMATHEAALVGETDARVVTMTGLQPSHQR